MELGCRDLHLVRQGAEARIYEGQYVGRDAILKQRFTKAYRHPVLDGRLNQRRLAQEARMMLRARKLGLDVPAVFLVDTPTLALVQERVHGPTVKAFLLTHTETMETAPEVAALARAIGLALGRLHAAMIIHGDLTTSNLMVRDGQPEAVVLIDFGLAFTSETDEDKAVDLYVLERALQSTHPNSKAFLAAILAAYAELGATAVTVLSRLEAVRQRGRKKLAFG